MKTADRMSGDFPCSYETDAVLLVHNALPFGKAVATRMHLWRCATCRDSVKQFRATSSLLALVFGGRALATSLPIAHKRRMQIMGVIALGCAATALAARYTLLAREESEPWASAKTIQQKLGGDCEPLGGHGKDLGEAPFKVRTD